MTVRLFEQATHAQLYSKFRPTYPKLLVDTICKFITKHEGSFGVAVDVACGSGQSTFHLADSFSRVVGVDISQPQVGEGEKKAQALGVKNVNFEVSSVDSLPLEDSSVDLVTCAQAWHWLEAENLYREAGRVLKPRGCLAVYGYGNVQLVNPKCQELLSYFYSHTLRGYWHTGRKHVDGLYTECRLPYRVTERHDMESPTSMELPHFIGYVSSWSGYRAYLEKHPETPVLVELQEGIQSILQQTPSTEPPQVDMVFPIFLILGLKD